MPIFDGDPLEAAPKNIEPARKALEERNLPVSDKNIFLVMAAMVPGKKLEVNEGIRLLTGKPRIDIPLKKINILLGPNNCGKSNILKLFLLLHQTIESENFRSPLMINGKFVKFGTYRNIAYRFNLFEHKFHFNFEDKDFKIIKFENVITYNQKKAKYEIIKQSIVSKESNFNFEIQKKDLTTNVFINSIEINDYYNHICFNFYAFLKQECRTSQYILSPFDGQKTVSRCSSLILS